MQNVVEISCRIKLWKGIIIMNSNFNNKFNKELDFFDKKRKEDYNKWRKYNFSEHKGFFPIFEDFSQYMNKLSTGAISMYVFLGLKSSYKDGTSFYSIEKLALHFNKSERTISNWLKELENNNLIYRKQKKFNSVSTTYLVPYN